MVLATTIPLEARAISRATMEAAFAATASMWIFTSVDDIRKALSASKSMATWGRKDVRPG
jgi:hypothetical protein